MTDTSAPSTAPTDNTTGEVPGPNLMVLKGIVWGLGVLLLLGMVLVAVMIIFGVSDDETVAPSSSVPPSVAVSTLPPLPLREGEQIRSVSAGDGRVFVVLEPVGDGARTRLLYTGGGLDGAWQELPTLTAEPVNNP